MATPAVSSNKDRILKKIISCLVQPDNEADKPVSAMTINRARTRVWTSAGVPSGGTGVATGDLCLDTTNDDVYRYDTNTWQKISVET